MTQPLGEFELIKQQFDKAFELVNRIQKSIIDVNKIDAKDETTQSKRFVLLRHEDISGISGTGIVAQGVLFPRGNVVLEWQTENSGIEFMDDLDKVLAVHGHDGATQLIWIDE